MARVQGGRSVPGNRKQPVKRWGKNGICVGRSGIIELFGLVFPTSVEIILTAVYQSKGHVRQVPRLTDAAEPSDRECSREARDY
jgi:hypothetical protein